MKYTNHRVRARRILCARYTFRYNSIHRQMFARDQVDAQRRTQMVRQNVRQTRCAAQCTVLRCIQVVMVLGSRRQKNGKLERALVVCQACPNRQYAQKSYVKRKIPCSKSCRWLRTDRRTAAFSRSCRAECRRTDPSQPAP